MCHGTEIIYSCVCVYIYIQLAINAFIVTIFKFTIGNRFFT